MALFAAIPLALLQDARLSLELGQRALLVELVAACHLQPATLSVRGAPVRLDRGEALVSSRGFAEQHGISRDAARRFLERLERLGWISRRPAVSGSEVPTAEGAPQAAPQAAPPPAPPPTLVRVEKWREILWPERVPAPQPGPQPGPPPGPSLPTTPKAPRSTSFEAAPRAGAPEGEDESAQPPSRPPRRPKAPAAEDPRHPQIIEWWVAEFERRKGYRPQLTGPELSAVKRLRADPALDLEAFKARLVRAWSDPFFAEKRPSLAYLEANWNAYGAAAPGAQLTTPARGPRPAAPHSAFGEGGWDDGDR